MQSIKCECSKLDISNNFFLGGGGGAEDLTDCILLKVNSDCSQLVLFVQRIVVIFPHVFLETEYSAVRIINYLILRGWSSLSVRTIGILW